MHRGQEVIRMWLGCQSNESTRCVASPTQVTRLHFVREFRVDNISGCAWVSTKLTLSIFSTHLITAAELSESTTTHAAASRLEWPKIILLDLVAPEAVRVKHRLNPKLHKSTSRPQWHCLKTALCAVGGRHGFRLEWWCEWLTGLCSWEWWWA